MKTIILLLFPILSFAQDTTQSFIDTSFWLTKQQRKEIRMPHYWAKQRKIAVQSFIGGWFDGENHFLRNNYDYYYKRWPNTRPQWSNPNLSSNNKYEDKKEENGAAYTFLGLRSTHELAFTTDKWHLNEFLDMLMLAGVIGVTATLYRWPKGIKWWRMLGRAATEGFIAHASHSIGKATAFKFYGIPNN